jgi:hypothetical protein
MKLKSVISKMLTNKTVLYVIFTLSLLNLLGYLIMGNIEATAYFILFGFLCSLFSKNYIIILSIPLVLVNSIMLLKNSRNIYEGMTNSSDKKEISEKKSEIKKDTNTNTNTNTKAKTKTNQGLPITPLEHDEKQMDNTDDMDMDMDVSEKTNTESFEMGNSKKGGYNIDYASTIEDAYDQLNGILGSDGIKRLTTDTQSLIQQQMQLTKAMEGMQPLIKNMKPLLENMGPLLDQAKGIMGTGDNKNLVDMAKKMSSSMPK